MPTYAYRCPRCAHAFERFHKMNDVAPQTCPECRATAESVITGGAGFVFKGSGFYETDYKRSPGKKDAGDKDTGDKETGDKEKKKTGDTKDSSAASKPSSDSGSSKSSGGDTS